MLTLGYVNLFWLHQFMNRAIDMADDWRKGVEPERCDGEECNYVLGYGTRSEIFLHLFLEKGLKPAFEQLNKFQRGLVLDCLALVLVKDDPQVWKYINRHDHIMGGEYALSPEPRSLFLKFFEMLPGAQDHSLSLFVSVPVESFNYDEGDRLELYDHC